MQSVPMAVEKLSLRRGEVLLLVSDGVNGELLQEVTEVSPEEPLRDLAGKFLRQGSRAAEDDATVALIRLRPAGLPPS